MSAKDFDEISMDEFIQSASTTDQLKELIAALKQRTQFFKEENVKMASTLKKLNLLSDDFHITENNNVLNKISSVQENFQTKDANVNSFALALSDQQGNNSKHYLSRLRVYIKMYINLNEKITSEIKNLQNEFRESSSSVNNWPCYSKEEVKNMEAKIKKYENELLKIKLKCPWLKSPEYNLLNIAKDIEKLTGLQKERETLLDELNRYKGLKPNIKDAMKQLADVKTETQKFIQQFVQNFK